MAHINALIELEEALFTSKTNQNMVEVIYNAMNCGLHIEEIYSMVVSSMKNRIPICLDNFRALIDACSKRMNAKIMRTSLQYIARKNIFQPASKHLSIKILINIYILRELMDLNLTNINFIYDIVQDLIVGMQTCNFGPQIFVILIMFAEEFYNNDRKWYSDTLLYFDTIDTFITYKRDYIPFYSSMKDMFLSSIENFFIECKSLISTGYMTHMVEKAIVTDDIDSLINFSLIPNNVKPNKIIKYSPFIPIKLRIMDYNIQTMIELSVACNSIKCFKYFITNQYYDHTHNNNNIEVIPQFILNSAIIGNNFEVIHILDRENKLKQNMDKLELDLALYCRRYDLLLWFYNKFDENTLTNQSWDRVIISSFTKKRYFIFDRMKEENCFISKERPMIISIMRANVNEIKYCLNNNQFITIPEGSHLLELAVLSNNMQILKFIYNFFYNEIRQTVPVNDILNILLINGNADAIKWAYFAFQESKSFFEQKAYSYLINYYRSIRKDKFIALFDKCRDLFDISQLNDLLEMVKAFRSDIFQQIQRRI